MTTALAVEGIGIDTRRRRIGPFDLRVGRGEVVGLVGPNGSGKTSCLRLALGLEPASVGTSRILGRPVTPWHPPVGVGVVLEADGSYPWASGREVLSLFAAVLGGDGHDVERSLDEVGLAAAADRPVRTYSRGMRQRLAIARARLGRPALLVLDEPTVALDHDAGEWLVALLADHVGAGGAALVASHDDTLLDALGARIVAVEGGRTR